MKIFEKRIYFYSFNIIIFFIGITVGSLLFGEKKENLNKNSKTSQIDKKIPMDFDTAFPKEKNTNEKQFDIIKKNLKSLGFSGSLHDSDAWKNFTEKITSKKIHELESKYNFSLLKSIIASRSLPEADFFNKYGFDLTEPTLKNRAILIQGLKSLTVDQFKKLVEMGIDLDFADNPDTVHQEKKLLAYAIESINGFNDMGKINYLMKEKGFSIEKGEDYLIPAIKAAKKISPDLLDEILTKTDPNGLYKHAFISKGIFFEALINNASSKVIDHFLNNGYKFSMCKPSENPFHAAAFNDNITPEQFQKMIDMAGSPNFSLSKITPLMMAVARNRPEQVKILLKNGADVNQVDAGGNSVYHFLNIAKEQDRYTDAQYAEMKKILGSAAN
ncbi:MAG: hypothetical protein CSB21_01880 [Deltaproteobacteria bacterium]|nr:MAG: hypothetical protein CSB21_01880 [Deltaproteobacteria bacterium]